MIQTTRLPIRPRSIHRDFQSLVETDPSKAALIDGATSSITTYEELFCRSEALAARYEERGLRAGDRLAIQLPNSADFIAAFLAALKLRLTAVPIDRDARESEIGPILSELSIRALLYRTSDETAGALPPISVRDVDAPNGEWVPLVKLTSGSTGRPKGILTSEENLIADCENICRTMDIRSDDRNLGAIPFSHSYGFSNLVTPLLLKGVTIVVSNDYLPLSVLDLCNRFECTVMPGIPMIFDLLGQSPKSDGGFRTIRTFISAGAPLTAATSRRFRERFGIAIHSFYGCSEVGGIAYDREGASVERNSVGAPMIGVKLAFDANGRLVVESDAVARGFINAAGDDARRFGPHRFATDDLATLTSSGELELTGRIGDLINIAGKKVNPREIEMVLLQMSGIRQAKVYG
ncbi:MAG TPA: class I adenylate-forming enzyme family protein, partial [Thermoanaerobaculia bacterium]